MIRRGVWIPLGNLINQAEVVEFYPELHTSGPLYASVFICIGFAGPNLYFITRTEEFLLGKVALRHLADIVLVISGDLSSPTQSTLPVEDARANGAEAWVKRCLAAVAPREMAARATGILSWSFVPTAAKESFAPALELAAAGIEPSVWFSRRSSRRPSLGSSLAFLPGFPPRWSAARACISATVMGGAAGSSMRLSYMPRLLGLPKMACAACNSPMR